MEDDVSAYVANKSLEQIEDYVRRGRQLASLAIEDLNARWVLAFNRWAADRKSTPAREWEDIAAEFTIRGLKAPFDLVKDAFDGLMAQSKEDTDRLFQNPEELWKREAELEAEIQRFRDGITRKPRS